jgi:hypothetical protein
MPTLRAFFAYASSPVAIGQCITEGVRLASQRRPTTEIHTWVENDICGRPLTDPIFRKIEESDFVIADVTRLNFNVTFEIGYALGLEKRVYLVRNSSVVGDSDLANKVGIYDTLGYKEYQNEQGLTSILLEVGGDNPIPVPERLNIRSPVYILQTPSHSQVMGRIIARLKKVARLNYRSFIPGEEIRVSAVKAIDDVAESFGVVVPLLAPSAVDSEIHNLRGAFIGGLASRWMCET